MENEFIDILFQIFYAVYQFINLWTHFFELKDLCSGTEKIVKSLDKMP